MTKYNLFKKSVNKLSTPLFLWYVSVYIKNPHKIPALFHEVHIITQDAQTI